MPRLFLKTMSKWTRAVWIPAFAGMTDGQETQRSREELSNIRATRVTVYVFQYVIPAKAGIHVLFHDKLEFIIAALYLYYLIQVVVSVHVTFFDFSMNAKPQASFNCSIDFSQLLWVILSFNFITIFNEMIKLLPLILLNKFKNVDSCAWGSYTDFPLYFFLHLTTGRVLVPLSANTIKPCKAL